MYKIGHSPVAGFGLFATQIIPKGEFIIEYIGEKITHTEEIKREKHNDKTGSTYIFQLNDDYSLDGAVGGNDSKYINHSCNPNCAYDIKNGHIYIYAKRNIKPKEELSYDYGFTPDPKPTPCFCKSPNCRGTINQKQMAKEPNDVLS